MNFGKKHNDYFYKILKDLSFNSGIITTQSNSDLTGKPSPANFYDKRNLEELDYKASETFFTQTYRKELGKILNSPENFENLKPHKKNNVQKQLDELSKIEYSWKIYNKRAVRDANLDEVTTHFREEFNIFREGAMLYLFPSDEALQGTQRAYMNYFPYKLEKFSRFIFPKLKDLEVINDLPNKLTQQDYVTITENYFSIHSLFNDLMTLVIKEAHDSLFATARKATKYHDNVLTVKNHELTYKYQKVFAMSCINAILNFTNEQKITDISIPEVSRPIHHQIYYRTSHFEHTSRIMNGWGVHSDNCQTILTLFEKCGVYTDIVKENEKHPVTQKISTIKKFVLPPILESYVFRPLRVPNVTTPGNVTKNDIDYLIKPVIFGSGNVSKSKNLIDSLSYSRTKRYRVSESFLNLSLKFLEAKAGQHLYSILEESGMDLSIPTQVNIDQQRVNYHKTRRLPTANPLQTYIALSLKNQFIGKYSIKLSSYYKTLKISDVTQIQSLSYLIQEREKGKLDSKIIDKKFAYTSCEVANWFRGYPIYITDSLCIRLRLYPNEHWLSRTLGSLKHLLCDYTPTKITLRGLINLFRAYYAADKALLEKYQDFLSKNTFSKKKGKYLLFVFFHKNYLKFTKIKEPLYFMCLHMELLKVEKTNKTAVNIEIDQSASGAVFLAYLLKNKKLAKVCGLLSKKDSSPYDYLKEKSSIFLNQNIKTKSPRIFEFISNSRKLHKYALMCFAYSQTHIGRMEDFRDRWLNETNLNLTLKDKKALDEFALGYEKFLNSLFPNLTLQINILKQVVELAVKDSGKLYIRTLEGEMINWTFYKYYTRKRSKFDPVENESKTYSVKLRQSNDLNDVDIKTHKHKLLSYLIHSIDAAVLRFFIRKMKDKYKARINHLHDCVIIHPNDVDNFYKVVEDLYKSRELFEMADNLFFDPIKGNASQDIQKKIEQLQKEFHKLGEGFEEDLDYDPRNLYKFES